jgi:hypothetical protein
VAAKHHFSAKTLIWIAHPEPRSFYIAVESFRGGRKWIRCPETGIREARPRNGLMEKKKRAVRDHDMRRTCIKLARFLSILSIKRGNWFYWADRAEREDRAEIKESPVFMHI